MTICDCHVGETGRGKYLCGLGLNRKAPIHFVGRLSSIPVGSLLLLIALRGARETLLTSSGSTEKDKYFTLFTMSVIHDSLVINKHAVHEHLFFQVWFRPVPLCAAAR